MHVSVVRRSVSGDVDGDEQDVSGSVRYLGVLLCML